MNGGDGKSGANGMQGAPGPTGNAGAPGPPGPVGSCDVPPGGEPLHPTLTIAAPKNGMYFDVGERLQIAITLVDHCQRPIDPSTLGTLNLYMAGPRAPTVTKTASKLLNCVTDRMAADHQHHYVNLVKPSFADPAQENLAPANDGFVFTTGAVSDEPPGTYTIGVLAKSQDGVQQALETAYVQIGTATVESFATGDEKTSACWSCHLGTISGKSYEMHIMPSASSPMGNYAIDQTPVVNCKLCHNLDGYSPNPIVRKVHAVHRGANLMAPGVAHPEYGLAADPSLADFTNVTFPSLPGHERDCTKCHVTDTYFTAPTRLACGTCHDNVFFDTGTLNPPRNFGKPYVGKMYAAGTAVSCTGDADCAGFGNFVTCDVPSGTCQRKTHPQLKNDVACPVCHTVDIKGLSPLPVKHDIAQRTQSDGVKVSSVVLGGGSGTNGSFKPGDVPVITFKLENKAGVVNALTNPNDPNYANWSANVTLAGPTDNPEPIWSSPINVKSATCPGPNDTTVPCLTFDANKGLYTFTFPIAPNEQKPGWPVLSQPPLNSLTVPRQTNVAGTYTLWLWVFEVLRPAPPNVANASWRDFSSWLSTVRFSPDGSDAPQQPRQLVMPSACNGCHVRLQAHGGSRQATPDMTFLGCPTCHTIGAEDQGVVGSLGAKCTTPTQAKDCTGFNAGWQACQDTDNDGTADTCVTTKDPTPGQLVEFRAMMHQLHFARKLGGYKEANNIPYAGRLEINSSDYSWVLFPQDVRNCTKCHADSGAACDANTPCGIGQACNGGTCTNVAWQNPSGKVCGACHDTAPAFAHIALNTYQGNAGPIETCEVCHGPASEFAVARVHAISNPYVPPYSR